MGLRHRLRSKRATSKVTTALDKPTVSKTFTDPRAQDDDMLAEENKKLDTKVKTLCRGVKERPSVN